VLEEKQTTSVRVQEGIVIHRQRRPTSPAPSAAAARRP